MLNSIKTENQRMTVEIGMDCIMPRIEIANDILYDAWEEFFGNVPQQSISALESERLGRILYAAFDMTSNAIREYHLMLGHYDLDSQGSVLRLHCFAVPSNMPVLPQGKEE